MGKNSAIAWTDHTHNRFWGCAKLSPACLNCYAETWAKRTGHDCFGPAPRRMLSQRYLNEPRHWAAAARKVGKKARVFCMSMGDILEDRPELEEPRASLWPLVRETSDALDWLFLSKRIANAARMVPEDIFLQSWWGATVESQDLATTRIPRLLELPAKVRFLSCEPLLEPLDLSHWLRTRFPVSDPGIDAPDGAVVDGFERAGSAWHRVVPQGIHWVIVGGESGPKARPFNAAWARALRDQCRVAGVSIFVKQMGAQPVDTIDHVFGWTAAGASWSKAPMGMIALDIGERAGADPAEWPADLRVQELPR